MNKKSELIESLTFDPASCVLGGVLSFVFALGVSLQLLQSLGVIDWPWYSIWGPSLFVLATIAFLLALSCVLNFTLNVALLVCDRFRDRCDNRRRQHNLYCPTQSSTPDDPQQS